MAARFKIKDEQGVAIPLNELDQQVCNIFNSPIHPKKYFSTTGYNGDNWFDVIGWIIAMKSLRSWVDVIDELVDMYGSIEFADDFVHIINVWDARGYKPHGF